MYLKPCRHCPLRETCEGYETTLRRSRGLGLTAATIRCLFYRETFQSGQQVRARFPCASEVYRDGEPTSAELTCIVMRWTPKGKVILYIEPDQEAGDTNHRIVRLWPDRLTLIQGTRSVCEECGLPDGVKIAGWHCDTCEAGKN